MLELAERLRAAGDELSAMQVELMRIFVDLHNHDRNQWTCRLCRARPGDEHVSGCPVARLAVLVLEMPSGYVLEAEDDGHG